MADDSMVDFFVSYNHHDLSWAAWINDALVAANYTTVIQQRDFLPGMNFMAAMDRAAKQARHTLAVLSENYLSSRFTEAEWTTALWQALRGKERALIPVIVSKCDVDGLLGPVVYIDLVDCDDESEARRRLLQGVKETRDAVPMLKAGFPGTVVSSHGVHSFPGAMPHVWNLQGLRSIPTFVGRQILLDTLDLRLSQSRPGVAVEILTGLGGVGKTRLAVEYAYRRMKHYDLVWLVRAEKETSILGDLLALAVELGVGSVEKPQQTLGALKRWLRAHGRWLLIFDNAQQAEEIEPYLPEGRGCVLVTSQLRPWDQLGETLEVGILPRIKSLEFLERRTGLTDPSLRDLANALGDLPLALEQAAAFLRETHLSVSAYLDLLRERAPDLFDQAVPRDYTKTVATTWQTSFARLEEESLAASQLLCISAFLAPDDIPQEIFVAGVDALPEPLATAVTDPLDFAKVIGSLQRYSFAATTGSALGVHRLVQQVIREIFLGPHRTKPFIEIALGIVRRSFPESSQDIRFWPVCSRLAQHARTVADHANTVNLDPMWSAWLLDRVATYVESSTGDYTAALHLLRQALHLTEKAFGPVHELVATRLNNLGSTLFNLEEYAGAQAALSRALTISESTLGPNHPGLASRLANLGAVVWFSGDKVCGRHLIRRAVQLADPNDETFSTIVLNYASEMSSGDDVKESKDITEKLLHMEETRLGHNHPIIARCLALLGELAIAERRWDDALSLLRRAVNILDAALGPGHLDSLGARRQLGSLLLMLGDLNAAASIFEDSIADMDAKGFGINRARQDKSVLRRWSLTLRDFLTTYGLVLRDLDKLREALDVYQLCRCAAEANTGSESEDVALQLNNEGLTLRDLGRVVEALPRLERAVEIGRRLESDFLCIFLANLTLALADQNFSERAIELGKQAVALAEHSSRSTTAVVLEKVGRMNLILGDSSACLAAQRRALSIAKEVFPANNLLLARIQASLSIVQPTPEVPNGSISYGTSGVNPAL